MGGKKFGEGSLNPPVVVSDVVQWYGYLAFTQKTWVQFPALEVFFLRNFSIFFKELSRHMSTLNSRAF